MKNILLSIIACSIACVSFAQSIAEIQAPKLIPPAPEAAALGKYGQIPVDKSTGIPSISIPLYDIKTPRFSLPISLSYHASGVKVGEISTWAGAGWSLNAGGVITRTVKDMPDEIGGFLYTTMPTYPNWTSITTTFLQSVCDHQTDTQPDNFFYNFGDQSGAFVFGQDTSHAPVLIPYKPIKIIYNKGANALTTGTFTVLDEKGNAYQFNDMEKSTNSPNGFSVTTSWYLTQMVSADKSDTVKFVYQADNVGYAQYSTNFNQTYTFNLVTNSGCTGAPLVGGIIPSVSNNHVDVALYIKTILFKGGKVDFVAKTGRLESTNNYAGPHLSLDSVIVSNYDYNQKKFNRLKSFKINTGYWTNNMYIYNTTSYSGSIYRLKLDSVVENDKNNIAVKTHKFGYNSHILPPINYYAQDLWGYYNGKNTNTSMVQLQQVIPDAGTFAGAPYTVGDADRSTDTAYMKAGLLEKITYPTKGYTMFDYEAHQYMSPASSKLDSIEACSIGKYNSTSTVTYTPTQAWLNQHGGQATFRVHIGKNVTGLSNSYATITRVSDGAVLYNRFSELADVNTTLNLTLTAGTQYNLKAVTMGDFSTTVDTALPTTTLAVNILDTIPPVLTFGGGPRVKSIRNYDSNGAILSTETYKYGTGENGLGVLMNNNIALTTSIQRHYYHYWEEFNGVWPIVHTCDGYYKIYSSSPTYALSTLGGSPVSYNQVAIYKGDVTQNIGKSLYNYANYPDSLYTVDVNYQNGIMLMPQTWRNGQMTHEAHYRNNGGSQYLLEQEKFNTYFDYQTAPTFSPITQAIYVGYKYETVGFQNPNWPPYASRPSQDPKDIYCYFFYPILSGSRVPAKTITINYANDGVTKLTQDTVKYAYGNLAHMYPTKITNYDGKGDSLFKYVHYPQDMDQSGIYGTMSAANIISPVVQFTQSKNATQLMQSTTNYSNSNPNGIINPSSVQLQVLNNPIETRLSYLNYDSYGNVATVAKTGGVPVSYIWGYNGSYPVAEVKNAKVNDIFYESFEDGHGNTGLEDSKTGHYSFLGTYSKTLSSLDNDSYLLTYWSKSGNVWTMVTTPVTVSAGSYSINLTGQVDDIRFYPASAQMTSYTYDPLVGVTSVTDQKGEISYYEYDALQRLATIRDQYKNIVKSFCYNYAGQSTDCFINLPSYSSAARDSIFIRNNCGTGYTGTAVHYILAAGGFTSNISQADANNQAKNDVIANGQNYANLNGSCTQNTIGFTMSNTTGAAGIQVTFYGATNYTFTVPTSGSSTVQLLPGTYSSMTVGPTSPSHTFTLGTRTPITNTIAGFSNVNISTGSSDLTLSVH